MSELAKALLAFQREAPEITKTHTAKVKTKSGAEYSYKYAELGAIMATVRPLLNKHGVILTQHIDADDHRVLITTLRHVDDPDAADHSRVTLPDTDDMQALGSAITYARRYAVIAMLGLVAEDDDDGARSKALPERGVETPSGDGGGRSTPPRSESAPGEPDPTDAQFVALKVVLAELQEARPPTDQTRTWADEARHFCETRFHKSSSTQLTRMEMGLLIDYLDECLATNAIPFN